MSFGVLRTFALYHGLHGGTWSGILSGYDHITLEIPPKWNFAVSDSSQLQGSTWIRWSKSY